jgi:hypothetical protein
MSRPSKASRANAIRKVIAGWDTYFGNVPDVVLAGTTFTAASLRRFLEADIATSDAADRARATWEKLVELERQSRARTNPVLRAIEQLVVSHAGDSKQAAVMFAAFGYKVRSRRKAKAAEKAEAAAKALATRKARGVVGKRKRAKIKGGGG